MNAEMTVRTGQQPQSTRRDPQGRFNIIVLGDFTGRASRGVTESLDGRKPIAADVDNFERTFAQLNPKLKLSGTLLPEAEVELAFSSLDDFHPDKLLAQVPSLARLAEARRLVLSPATAEQGKVNLQASLGAAIAAPPTQPAASTPAPESDEDTMARLLGGLPPAARKSPASSSSQLDQFLRQVVAPHVSPASGSWQSDTVATAEIELGNRLNSILHQPDFQALEAAWRGLDMLVRRIESPEETALFLLDVSLAELQEDLLAHKQAEQSALFRLLRDRKPRLLIVNFTFGCTADDLRALSKFADVAAMLCAPLIATAAPPLVGCDSFASHPDPDDWTLKLSADASEILGTFRQSPHAAHVGLAAPRFLLRQPYGKSGDSIATFPFEEMRGEERHESFLWGHPGVLCACAVIDARQADDPELTGFRGGEIGNLPMHKFTEDGEVVVKPYAEAWLTDRAVDRMLACGVIPIVPMKNHNAIRLYSLRSMTPGASVLSFA